MFFALKLLTVCAVKRLIIRDNCLVALRYNPGYKTTRFCFVGLKRLFDTHTVI